MSPVSDTRTPLAIRLANWCRSHGAPLLFGLAVGLALAIGGYALLVPRPAPVSPPIGTATPPIAAASDVAAPRGAVVWRDETGAVFRTRVNPQEFERLLRARREAVEAARTESREQASAEILATLKPVFADMKERVPGYAGWYFSYGTSYELVAQGLISAVEYLGRSLDLFSPQRESLYETMSTRMVEFLKDEYAEQLVRPPSAQIRLQAAFDKSYATLRAQWERLIAGQRAAMREFIDREAATAERLPSEQAAGLTLDWDGQIDDRSVMHQDVILEQGFRRGLLTVQLRLPQSARPPAERDTTENSRVDSDKIRGAIVTLFDKVVGTVVSKMGNLAIGIFAGSTASGTTAFGLSGMPAAAAGAAAPGLASAIPIGAAIGFATTMVAEMITNRLQASLGRREFEDSVRQSLDATENAVETAMIAVLHQQIEAWYADINPP